MVCKVKGKKTAKKLFLLVLTAAVFSSFVGFSIPNSKEGSGTCCAKTLYDSNKDEGGFVQWVQEKNMWFGVKAEDGVFEKGSKFNVTILEKGSNAYDKRVKLFDGELREKVESDNIMLFDLDVTKPDGSKYTNLAKPVDIYIEVPFNWDFFEAKTVLLKEFTDATFETDAISLDLGDQVVDTETTHTHNFIKFKITHFAKDGNSFTLFDEQTVWDFIEHYAWIFGIIILVAIVIVMVVVKKKRKTNG